MADQSGYDRINELKAKVEALDAAPALPTDSDERKDIPLATGCLYYFPNALADVARLSKVGNDKHNPGEPLHHARGKSMDHADTILRHQAEVGTVDTDGIRHATKVAWRALAQLQEELEREEGVPMARGARPPVDEGGTCPEPGGCASCPEPPYCKGLRVGIGITDPADEQIKHPGMGER